MAIAATQRAIARVRTTKLYRPHFSTRLFSTKIPIAEPMRALAPHHNA